MSSKRHSSHHAAAPQEPLPEQEDLQAYTEGSEPSVEPRPVTRQPTYEIDRIGDILRRVREHRGEDLESISDYLRIRPSYLIALENSRYDDLPADAYVIGFLRTYALYLGLDGKGAIDQYRREMAGRRRKPELNMPQPMSEGRAPTIAVLVGAAVAVLLVYAIWYGLSSPDPSTREKAVPLPSASTEKTLPVTPDSTSENQQPAATAAAPADTTLAAQTATSDGIALSEPASTATAPLPEGKGQPKDAPNAAKTEPAQPEQPSDKAPAKDVKDQKTEKETPVVPATKETKAETSAKDSKDKASKDKIESAPLPPPTDESAKKDTAASSYGDKSGKSRLTIKADKESWVLVTDSKGNTVFEKTLKPGESYSVPSTKGLKLTTGNAGGMTFSLDGASLPKMHSSDAIVRAVPLDPDKIKSRLTDGDAASSDQ